MYVNERKSQQHRLHTWMACALCLTLAASCAKSAEPIVPAHDSMEDEVSAQAELRDESGELVASASLTPMYNGVAMSVEVFALPPGTHGFHIHETGACEGPDFTTAGGHFNPLGADHGLSDGDGAHLGDLPNLAVDPSGEGETRIVLEGVSLAMLGERSLLAGDGTALVVHAQADDYETDPAGAAGPRIACGVIEPR